MVKSRTVATYVTRASRRMAICRNICAFTPARSRIPATFAAGSSPRRRSLSCTSNGILANGRGNASTAQNPFCTRIHGNVMCADIKVNVRFNAPTAIADSRSNGRWRNTFVCTPVNVTYDVQENVKTVETWTFFFIYNFFFKFLYIITNRQILQEGHAYGWKFRSKSL